MAWLALAIPKSPIFTTPVREANTLALFTSRWMNPSGVPSRAVPVWAAWSPSQIRRRTWSATDRGTGRPVRRPVSISRARSAPSMYSIAMKYWPLAQPSSRIWTMLGWSSCEARRASSSRSSTTSGLRAKAGCSTLRATSFWNPAQPSRRVALEGKRDATERGRRRRSAEGQHAGLGGEPDRRLAGEIVDEHHPSGRHHALDLVGALEGADRDGVRYVQPPDRERGAR